MTKNQRIPEHELNFTGTAGEAIEHSIKMKDSPNGASPVNSTVTSSRDRNKKG